MSKLTIMGVKTSPPCRAVFLTAKAIGVELTFEHVDMSEEQHLTNPQLMKHNVLTKVPVLVIDSGEKSIADSHAINTYLIRTHGKEDTLYPKDPYQRAQIDRMLHFDSGILFPRLDILFRTQCYTKKVEKLKPEDISNFLEGLSMLEKLLEKKKYLTGDNITVADLACVATVTSAIGILKDIRENRYSNVLKWVERLEKLPYYQEANGNGAKELRNYITKRLQEAEEQQKSA